MGVLRGTVWDDLPLQRYRTGADPDAPRRTVAVPAGWGEDAAAALAALAPGRGPVSLPRAAEPWIGRVVAAAGPFAEPAAALALAEGLRALLLARRGAPGAEVWRQARRSEPRFVLNLPAFLEPEGDFDCPGFAEACTLGVQALDALTGGAPRLRLGFADLAGLLAGLGLPYDSIEARAVGAGVAALARGAAEAASGRMAARLGAREPVALLWPAPPATTPVPGLAAAARTALEAAAASPGLRHAALLALAPADAAEALLGAETAGLGPAAGATRAVLSPDGQAIEVPTRAALRAARVAPNGASDGVARLLAAPDARARQTMREVVADFLHAAPPAPLALAASAMPPGKRTDRFAGRSRTSGTAAIATVGGQRVALRSNLDDQGRLIGIGFDLPREAAARRAGLDDVARAVSAGLAHGVPLETYVDALGYAPGGPAGVVTGDPDIRRATSILDWAIRRLARERLERQLPDPPAPPGQVPSPGLPFDQPGEPGTLRLAG